jgi:hypothetical protein
VFEAYNPVHASLFPFRVWTERIYRVDLQAIGNVLAFLVYAYLMYEQNVILKQQNRIMASESRRRSGAAPALSNRYWPIWVMLGLTVATYVAIGIGYHHHEMPRQEVNWDNYQLKIVSNEAYKDETVKLDGYEYQHVTFDNVMLDYEGTAPTRLTDVQFLRKPGELPNVRATSSDPVVKQTMLIMEAMAELSGGKINYSIRP